MTKISVEDNSRITITIDGHAADLSYEEARELLGHLKRILKDKPYWDYSEEYCEGRYTPNAKTTLPEWPYKVTSQITASDVI